MAKYEKSENHRLVKLRNPVAYVIGHLPNGKPVVAWCGEQSIPETALSNPVEIDLGKDAKGKPLIGFISRSQYDALTRAEEPRKEQKKYFGQWEQKLLNILGEIGDSVSVDQFIETAIKRTPKQEGRKDRRREFFFRALQSLVKGGEIAIRGGHVVLTLEESASESDLIEE